MRESKLSNTKSDTDESIPAFSGPAVLSNRFFISLGDSGVRIAFCEKWSPESPTVFRTAVTMGFQDTIALKNLLQTMLTDVEADIEAAKSQNDN